jgi:riboflavin kinase / FMN adenylyltransferase
MPLEVFYSVPDWTARFGADTKTALTVGSFDGIHLGHQKILRGVVERARATRALAAAVTFDPHPLKILRPAEAPPLISTLQQRLAGFEEIGLAAALILRFDLELSRLSPEEFVRRMLLDKLHLRSILVGGNFRFGHQQAGDAKRLAELGQRFGFAVRIVPPVIVRGQVVSSTAIRRAVYEGRVEQAARLLGRPFVLTGAIRPGSGRGRSVVFPTLNLAPEQELCPAVGVYATQTRLAGRLYRSATNVGVRPTFDGGPLSIESHLLDFSETVSSGPLEIRFWKRLRSEKKFSGPGALRAQISRDLARTHRFFERISQARSKGTRQPV